MPYRDLTVQVGSVGAPIAGSVPLHDFVAAAGSLSHAQRMTIVQQALVLLEGNHVHLPLKVAMHAVNPVQRLRLLRARLGQQTVRVEGYTGGELVAARTRAI